MENAMLFDIQRFSVHDGPGIRTTFFLKGCSLSCKWCHNPEGIKRPPQLMYFNEKCIKCGDCVAVCPNHLHSFYDGQHIVDFNSCTACGSCERACPADGLKITGKEYSPDDLLKEALKDLEFYGKNGGVTFSGGEPMLAPEFLFSTLKLLKDASLHTGIDTAGNVDQKSFEKVIPYTDVFLYDIKGISPKLHQEMTLHDNSRILANYRFLVQSGCELYVRVPVINGYNASPSEMERIAEFIKENYADNVKQILLIPYHKLGRNKYECIGAVPQCGKDQLVKREDMEELYDIFRKYKLPLE